MKERIIEWLDSLDEKQLRCVWLFICGMTGKLQKEKGSWRYPGARDSRNCYPTTHFKGSIFRRKGQEEETKQWKEYYSILRL